MMPSKEQIESFIFTCQISSGPTVYIYYDNTTRQVLSSFATPPKGDSVIIYEYVPSYFYGYGAPYKFKDLGKIIEQEIVNFINKKIDDRDNTINKILD